ncbi:MAG: FHA domain-containing protein [Phototrophicaceae bacterium]
MMKTQKTHILSQQDESIKVLAAQQSRDLSATASLKEAREIMLTIRSHKEFIRVTEGDEFEFGRYEYPDNNQLNLSPYGALESGISRQHAKLYLLGGRLYIADMGSTNGTYIRGKLLTPAVPTLIRNGDELLLGRLRVKIQF